MLSTKPAWLRCSPLIAGGCDHESKAQRDVLEVGGRSWFDRTASYATHPGTRPRSEEHTSELQSLMRISYAVFCLKKKKKQQQKEKKYTEHKEKSKKKTQ